MPPSQQLKTAITIDLNPDTAPESQSGVHNRWHPDIPAVATVSQGQEFRVECHDFTGGLIDNNDNADDVDVFDWNRDHCLSGPIHVTSAEPGDVLRVDILDIQPFPSRPWGFSFVQPGIGPLDAHTGVVKTIWDFDGTTTSSRHIEGVSFTGRPHCETIGTAPSQELLQRWIRRERALNDKYSTHGVTCAHMPSECGAYIGNRDLSDDERAQIKREGARTTPARENGGNIDCRTLSRGSTIFLPVFVPGAKLSIGDLHFSQADGEPTCAIEMAGMVTVRCSILQNTAQLQGINAPILIPPGDPPRLAFHGLSLGEDDSQYNNDATAAYNHAANRVIAWLRLYNYSLEQAITILATAPVETRILAVANTPTVNVSISIPTNIFHFDVTPSAQDPIFQSRSSPAYLSEGRCHVPLIVPKDTSNAPSVFELDEE